MAIKLSEFLTNWHLDFGLARISDVQYLVSHSVFEILFLLQITKLSRPLPVEYLLIDVPTATPLMPRYTFHVSKNQFPIENRPMEGHLQDFTALANHRANFTHDDIVNFFLDFHLLIYLGTQTVSPLDLNPLLDALRTDALERVFHWMESETWGTLEALIQHHQDGYQ